MVSRQYNKQLAFTLVVSKTIGGGEYGSVMRVSDLKGLEFGTAIFVAYG